MNEKEFLIKFAKHLDGWCNLDLTIDGDHTLESEIYEFLKEHHKEYFEVEFVKKTEEESDMYIQKITPIEFTAEQANTMLEKYLEQRKKFK